MSADDYWLVRRTPDHRYVPLHGFLSDDRLPVISEHPDAPTFATPAEALQSVVDRWAEYGHSIDAECNLTAAEFDARRAEIRDAADTILATLSDAGATSEVKAMRLAERQSDYLSDTQRQHHRVNADLSARIAGIRTYSQNLHAAKEALLVRGAQQGATLNSYAALIDAIERAICDDNPSDPNATGTIEIIASTIEAAASRRAAAATPSVSNHDALLAWGQTVVPCSCDEAYTSRSRWAPDCAWHQGALAVLDELPGTGWAIVGP